MDQSGAAKLAWIKERLAEGMTVYLGTYTRTTKVTPKTAKRWEESGQPLFKVGSDGALLMARGRHYDDATGCVLRASLPTSPLRYGVGEQRAD